MSRFLLQPPAGVWKLTITSAMCRASGVPYQAASRCKRHGAGAETFFGNGRNRRARCALGGERGAVDAHLLLRAVEVGAPDGAVFGRKLSDTRRRDGLGRFVDADDCRVERSEHEKACEEKGTCVRCIFMGSAELDGEGLCRDAERSDLYWEEFEREGEIHESLRCAAHDEAVRCSVEMTWVCGFRNCDRF